MWRGLVTEQCRELILCPLCLPLSILSFRLAHPLAPPRNQLVGGDMKSPSRCAIIEIRSRRRSAPTASCSTSRTSAARAIQMMTMTHGPARTPNGRPSVKVSACGHLVGAIAHANCVCLCSASPHLASPTTRPARAGSSNTRTRKHVHASRAASSPRAPEHGRPYIAPAHAAAKPDTLGNRLIRACCLPACSRFASARLLIIVSCLSSSLC